MAVDMVVNQGLETLNFVVQMCEYLVNRLSYGGVFPAQALQSVEFLSAHLDECLTPADQLLELSQLDGWRRPGS